MMKKPFFISTPIYYPSDKLHIGHAYCTTIADTVARYKKMAGYDTYFMTGSDEHGQKIQRKAEEAGVTPVEYVDNIVASFKDLWVRLHVSYDDFVRTTEPRHYEVVQDIFQKIYDQGDIYKSEYEGWYCVPCETFWPQSKLEEGNLCPDCHRPVETMKEESYFFKMSKYQDRWLQYMEDHPEFIQPAARRNEMINFVKQGLEDLCVSRTTFSWGIPIPFDPKHVVYVWFDALANYITSLGYKDNPEKFAHYWPHGMHLVGKEIVRFHTIIWPIILMALDLPLPEKVYGHGWLIVEGDKMSKSKGNVIDPVALIEEFGADQLRYFLLRDVTLGQDGNFSRDALIQRLNSDLSNDLGNLMHRTLSMVKKFRAGVITKGTPTEAELTIAKAAEETVKNYETKMEAMDINGAYREIWDLISKGNKYVDETAPWGLAKKPEEAAHLDAFFYTVAELLRIAATLITPAMPTTAPKIFSQLGLSEGYATDLDGVRTFGGFPDKVTVAEVLEPVFPRIEIKEEEEPKVEEIKEEVVEKPAGKAEITIDEFAKTELRVGKVLTAGKVEKADRLLQFTIDMGNGEVRTILSGIAIHYPNPEELVGRNVVVVANLKPVKIRGIMSQGMLLSAAHDEAGNEKLVLVDAPGMEPGSEVR
ncbi:MAG: methionine--tRNA ligase [Negativicutes bacterium]|nr:methionine--tRNA ligase [Negativicutes bacterium]